MPDAMFDISEAPASTALDATLETALRTLLDAVFTAVFEALFETDVSPEELDDFDELDELEVLLAPVSSDFMEFTFSITESYSLERVSKTPLENDEISCSPASYRSNPKIA